MRILHYNDEERQLHAYMAERGHTNLVLPSEADPLATARTESFDAAFIGLHPHGLQLIRLLHRRNPDCLVTIITADRNARLAVEAMKLGAFDYMLTPLEFTEVERSVIMMMREHEGQRERKGLEHQLTQESTNGSSPASAIPGRFGVTSAALPSGTMKQIVEQVEHLAIQRALQDAGGNVSLAARTLDISRTTLYSKMKAQPVKSPAQRP